MKIALLITTHSSRISTIPDLIQLFITVRGGAQGGKRQLYMVHIAVNFKGTELDFAVFAHLYVI